MDTVHCCVFLTFIVIGIMKCGEIQHEDGLTYVSTTGIDNILCFIDNPCQSFTYVLLNAHISCDDNCVIIRLDYQPRVINSKVDIVFRKNQCLHVGTINEEMINVSFGSIQINSRGSSNMTFENLLLIFGSISFSSFKQSHV